jgi:hypothetical protein
MENVPVIKAPSTKTYNIKQSKYDVVPKVPFKSVIYAPSNSGKTVLITNLIEHIYRGCFERVYIFSPSIAIDDSWQSTKKYLDNAIKLSDDEPPLYHSNFDESVVEEIMTTQKKVIDHIKKNKTSNKLYSILIVLDDVADDNNQRNSQALKSLFVKGRHSQISVILSSQKGSLLNPVCRVNADSLYVFKLRNFQDLDMLITELSALLGDKKEMLNVYKHAVEYAPYSFLFVNLKSQDPNKMFFINFQQRITLE